MNIFTFPTVQDSYSHLSERIIIGNDKTVPFLEDSKNVFTYEVDFYTKLNHVDIL
jgi:hypothetical protein